MATDARSSMRVAGRSALLCLALTPWLAVRLGWLGDGSPVVVSFPAGGHVFPVLFVDATSLWLLPGVVWWTWKEPAAIEAKLTVVWIALAHAWGYSAASLMRLYGGGATAYDLGMMVQALWRAGTGHSMTMTWPGGVPLWADHGSFGALLFAPFAAWFDDAGTGVLIAQGVVVAAWIPALFAFARTLGLPCGVALSIAVAAGASRSIQHGVMYDFHPESALPLLLLLFLGASARGRFRAAVAFAILAALLKDMAALTVAGAAAYLGISRRERRYLVLASGLAAILLVDVFVIPRFTSAVSYANLHSPETIDYGLGLAGAGMRALSTMVLGWLHPFAWCAGGPWALIAAISPNLNVKGILFQYAFLHVPVAFAGAAYLLAALHRKGRSGQVLAAVWCLAVVTVNAQGRLPSHDLRGLHARFREVRNGLHARPVAPPGVAVATDACLAPYLMERTELFGLCLVDTRRLTGTGDEEWTFPSEAAFGAERIVVDTGCMAHGACLEQQLAEARRRGYVESVKGPRLLVLKRPIARPRATSAGHSLP